MRAGLPLCNLTFTLSQRRPAYCQVSGKINANLNFVPFSADVSAILPTIYSRALKLLAARSNNAYDVNSVRQTFHRTMAVIN